MPETDSLLVFLGHVRRRHITTQLIRHGITSLVFGLSGLILLLLAGTQIFDWYWPTLLFTAAFGYGAWRFLRQLPSAYRLAQIVDRRLDLNDALSTAFYFRGHSPDELIAAQRRQANHLASSLSSGAAIPMEWPKTVYAAAVLSLVAVTLIGIRYGILNSLDLSAPVSEAIVDVFRFSTPAARKQIAQQNPKQLSDELKKAGMSIDEGVKDELNKIEQAKEGEITTPDIPDVNDLSEAARGEKGKASVEGKGVNPGEGEGGEGGAPSENADPNDSPKDSESDGKESPKSAPNKQAKGKEGGSQSNQNSSMLDKMKDAFANMMNKMKMPNPSQGNQQQASSQKGGEKGPGQQQGGQQSGKQPGKGNENDAGADSPSDQNSEASEKQASAKGQGGDKSSSMQAPPDAKSGVGKADGDKSLKDAEQVQAMGKISEILGKRAKDVSGEVMVEVNGGKQQLRTQYSNSSAAHGESGGEIHRDEVPLQHQHYIQQYFEQVRKQAPAPRK